MFNSQVTYVWGGFFLDYQDVPRRACGRAATLGSANRRTTTLGRARIRTACATPKRSSTAPRRDQPIARRTIRRRGTSWEAKTDGTYFLTHMLGGDHSLKFGLGWRKSPIQTFSHYSGGARAQVECVGNILAGCGDGTLVPVGSPRRASCRSRPFSIATMLNNDWWTYNGYLQDGYSRGKIRLNGGLRYDWQTSKYLGGCAVANPIIARTSLPSQCDTATAGRPESAARRSSRSATGRRACRPPTTCSATARRRFTPAGRTSTTPRSCSPTDCQRSVEPHVPDLGTQPVERRVQPDARVRCWTDANHDGIVQASELTGSRPRAPNGQLRRTACSTPAGNIVDPSAKIGRTREAVVGIQHELDPNLAVGCRLHLS